MCNCCAALPGSRFGKFVGRWRCEWARALCSQWEREGGLEANFQQKIAEQQLGNKHHLAWGGCQYMMHCTIKWIKYTSLSFAKPNDIIKIYVKPNPPSSCRSRQFCQLLQQISTPPTLTRPWSIPSPADKVVWRGFTSVTSRALSFLLGLKAEQTTVRYKWSLTSRPLPH